MKKYLLASAALVFSAGVSFAADLPVVEPEPEPIAFDWTGAYIGLQVGFATKRHDNRLDFSTVYDGRPRLPWTSNFDVGDEFGRHKDGINGGGQIGYLFQTGGGFVFGIEGAVIAADFEDIFNNDFEDDVGVIRNNEFRHNVDFIATVSGRIGFAWDRALFYAKGGWSGADFNVDFFDGFEIDVGDEFRDDDGDFISGFNVGGGIDYAITDNFIIGARIHIHEIRRRRLLGSRHLMASGTISNHELEIQTINVKASYKF